MSERQTEARAEPQPRLTADGQENNRPAVIINWLLYALAIPSGYLTPLIGIVIAYVVRDGATGWSRTHIDRQIQLFWRSLIWSVLLWVLLIMSVFLSWLLLPIVMIIVAALALVVLSIYFTVASVFGLLKALNRQPA